MVIPAMINQEILDYVKNETRKGKTREELEKSLLAVGWKKEDVDQIFQTNPQIPTFQTTPSFPTGQPHYSQNTTSNNAVVKSISTDFSSPVHKKGHKSLFIFSIIITVILLLLGSSTLLLAYDKIPLPESQFKNQISELVMSVPFLPKTPKYILNAAISAQKKLTRMSVDFSLAASSKGLSSTLNSTMGLNQLDLALKGSLDYTDKKNPLLLLNLPVTKDFNLDLRLKDKISYFKINKFPQNLLSLTGMDKDKITPFFDKWIYYDATPLETEARKNLDNYSNNQSPQNELTQKTLSYLLNDEILPNIKMSGDKIGNFDTYKMHLTVTKDMLDRIMDKLAQDYNTNKTGKITEDQKPSKYIDDFNIDAWFDKNEYYLRQIVVMLKARAPKTQSMSIIDSTPLKDLEDDTFDFVIVLKQADFNKPFTVEIPSQSEKLEDVVSAFMESSGLLSGQKNAIYSSVKSDINQLENATLRYYTVKMVLPKSLDDLAEAGEIMKTSVTRFNNEQIYLKTIQNGEKVFIYTLTEDPNNITSPFFSITISKNGSSIEKNYSKSEIDIIIKN